MEKTEDSDLMMDIQTETTIHDLPKEIVMHILGFVSPWNLFQLSTVSTNWHYFVRISVTELDCSMRKLHPKFYSKIFDLINLQKLTMLSSATETTQLEGLTRLANLQSFNIFDKYLDTVDRGVLQYINQMRKLTSLNGSFVFNESNMGLLTQLRLLVNSPINASFFESLTVCTRLHSLVFYDDNDPLQNTPIRIEHYSHLTKFKIWNSFHKIDMDQVAQMTALKCLALHYTDGVSNWPQFTALTNLQELTLSWFDSNIPQPIEYLTTAVNLTFLDMFHLYWTPEIIGSLSRMTNLRSLRVNRMKDLSPACFTPFTFVSHLTILGVLSYDYEEVDPIMQLTWLKSLHVSSPGSNPKHFKLADFTQLTTLSRLHLENVEIDEGYEEVLKKMSRLKKIYISAAPNLDQTLNIYGFEHVSVLSRLQALELSNCKLNAKTFEAIGKLRGLNCLTIQRCDLEPEDLPSILYLTTLYDLKYFKIKTKSAGHIDIWREHLVALRKRCNFAILFGSKEDDSILF